MKPLALSRSTLRRLNLFASFFLCFLSTLCALRKLNYPLIGIDDANIYFVYAKNLANGYGFVYNIGGERVEGFTSLLWTLISAIAFKFFAHPEITLLIINIVLVSLGIACALNYLQSSFSDGKRIGIAGISWSAFYLLMIFTSPRYITWNTTTLMENALWSTLLLLITIFVIRDNLVPRTINYQFIPLTILLFVTRPESIVWVAVFTLILFFRFTFQTNLAHASKALAPSVISSTLTLVFLTLFRLYYFGYPLPNTFYAKVSPSFAYDLEQGTIYLIRYFLSDFTTKVIVISVFLGCIESFLKPMPKRPIFFLPFIAATGLFVPMLTGGDHFASFRFYQNIHPIMILCAIYIAQKILSETNRNLKFLVLPSRGSVLLTLTLTLPVIFGLAISESDAWDRFVPEVYTEFYIAKHQRENGVFLENFFSSFPSLPSIGVIGAGGIKYAYSGKIIDLTGLNNTIMAHNHGDRMGYKNHAAFEVKTFYELQPDILLPTPVDKSWQYDEMKLKNGLENVVLLKGLFDDPQFLKLYEFAKVSKKSNSENRLAVVAWFRKDIIKFLNSEPAFVVEKNKYDP